MSEQNKVALSSLMKKQISEKSSKKDVACNSKNNCAEGEKSKGQQDSEEAEAKKLEEAKKSSRGKSAQYDQSEMIKKLILESIVKYTAVILFLVIFTIGLIKFGPALLAFFNGLIYKALMAAIAAK